MGVIKLSEKGTFSDLDCPSVRSVPPRFFICLPQEFAVSTVIIFSRSTKFLFCSPTCSWSSVDPARPFIFVTYWSSVGSAQDVGKRSDLGHDRRRFHQCIECQPSHSSELILLSSHGILQHFWSDPFIITSTSNCQYFSNSFSERR